MSEKKTSGAIAQTKSTGRPAKRAAAIASKSSGFPDGERVAMKERAQELQAAAHRDRRPMR